MSIRNYSSLAVWQSAMRLVGEVYRISASMPSSERFGLTAQLRRAAVSVPSNIAEGHACRSRRDYLRFVVIALGSLAELETQLEIASRLGYFDATASDGARQLVERTAQLLRGVERALRRQVQMGDLV